MNKETIRPLLVEALEKARFLEELEAARVKTFPESSDWQATAHIQEAWQAARLKRAQAELQLWLAGRQWEREEMQELAGAGQTSKPA